MLSVPLTDQTVVVVMLWVNGSVRRCRLRVLCGRFVIVMMTTAVRCLVRMRAGLMSVIPFLDRTGVLMMRTTLRAFQRMQTSVP